MHPTRPRNAGREKRVRGRKGQALRCRRMQQSDGRCVDCLARGRQEVATVIDHIVPLALGGKDDDANCRALCDECHRARTAEQFGRRLRVAVGADGWPAGPET